MSAACELPRREDEVCPELELPRSDVAHRVDGGAARRRQSTTPWITADRAGALSEYRMVPGIQEHTLQIKPEPFVDRNVLGDAHVLEETVRSIEDEPLVIGSRRRIRIDERRVCSCDRAARYPLLQASLAADAQILGVDEGDEGRARNAMHAHRTLYLGWRNPFEHHATVGLAVEGAVSARDAEGESALDGGNGSQGPAAHDPIQDSVVVGKCFASAK